MRVLLADDHGIVRRGLRSLLESDAGLTVVAEAADGLEALRLCEEHQPETLIVDIGMPKMNGIEFLKAGQLGDVLTCQGIEQLLQGRHGIYDMTVSNQRGETVLTIVEWMSPPWSMLMLPERSSPLRLYVSMSRPVRYRSPSPNQP